MLLSDIKPLETLPTKGQPKPNRATEELAVFDADERLRQDVVESELDLLIAVIDDRTEKVVAAAGDDKLNQLARLHRDVAAILLFKVMA